MLSGYLDDVYAEWLGSAVSCCTPLGRSDDEGRKLGGTEKPMTILHDRQPQLVPPPIPESQYRPSARSTTRPSTTDLMARSREFAARASSRGSFSVRRTLNAYNGTRRPPIQISAPTDFRHVQNALPRRDDQSTSSQDTEPTALAPRPPRFRPLELSIYLPENRLSDLLPYFGPVDKRESVEAETNKEVETMGMPKPPLIHSRSSSSISTFLVARKPVHSRDQSTTLGRSSVDTRCTTAPSVADTAWTSIPPSMKNSIDLEKDLPVFPAAARLRSHSEAPVPLIRAAEQYGRVKSVLQEREELDRRLQDIETIIEERQTIYLNRMSNVRPMTLPATPRMPAQAAIASNTSLSSTHSVRPPLDRLFSDPATAFNSHPPTPPEQRTWRFPTAASTPPPPPPLPLILQPSTPPLRKKKSFSRISTWLSRTPTSPQLTSLTNSPRPVTSKEGFYQCVEVFSPSLPSARIVDMGSHRTSVDTVSVLSYKSAESGDAAVDFEDDQAELTTGTTGSSPYCDSEKFSTFGRKRGGDLRDRFLALERERELAATRERMDEDADSVEDDDTEVGVKVYDESDESVHVVSPNVFAADALIKERIVVGVAF